MVKANHLDDHTNARHYGPVFKTLLKNWIKKAQVNHKPDHCEAWNLIGV